MFVLVVIVGKFGVWLGLAVVIRYPSDVLMIFLRKNPSEVDALRSKALVEGILWRILSLGLSLFNPTDSVRFFSVGLCFVYYWRVPKLAPLP